MPGEPCDISTVNVHDIDVGVAIIFTCESYQAAVRRDFRHAFTAVAESQPAGCSAFSGNLPEISAAGEDNNIALNIRVLHERILCPCCQCRCKEDHH